MRHPIDTAALNANQFTWTGKKGVAEASDLGAASGHPAMLPTAIRLHSNRTGDDKFFHLVSPFYNDEDELMAWVYTSHDGFRIDILND